MLKGAYTYLFFIALWSLRIYFNDKYNMNFLIVEVRIFLDYSKYSVLISYHRKHFTVDEYISCWSPADYARCIECKVL